jgi:hypothetical protein
MPSYCVHTKAQAKSGDHEVHDLSSDKGCLPAAANRINLGTFSSCSAAVTAAKRYYDDVDGCFYCANDCHTG